MKTISQISKEIGVSTQAVYKKIKKEPLSTGLQGLLSTVNNKLTVGETGEKLIKSAFNKSDVSTVSTNPLDNLTTEFIRSLQAQIETLTLQNTDLRQQLNEERQHSREQAEKMLPLLEQAQMLASNAQHLQAFDNVKPQLTEEKKKGFFNRIFSKDKQ